LAVGTLCVLVEGVLFVRFGGVPAEYMTFSRMFVFECPPLFVLMVGSYVVIWGLVVVAAVKKGGRAARLVRRVAIGVAVTVAVCQVYLKYYCRGMYGNVGHIKNLPDFARNGKDDDGTGWWNLADGLHLRFVPKGLACFGDLDQVVAVILGLVTLSFSILDAVRSRRKGPEKRTAGRGGVLPDGEGGAD
jgi:hypothetical protein